jgi:hypothetical protein
MAAAVGKEGWPNRRSRTFHAPPPERRATAKAGWSVPALLALERVGSRCPDAISHPSMARFRSAFAGVLSDG